MREEKYEQEKPSRQRKKRKQEGCLATWIGTGNGTTANKVSMLT